MGCVCRLAMAVSSEVLQRNADKTLLGVPGQRTPRLSENESMLRRVQTPHVKSSNGRARLAMYKGEFSWAF